MDNANAVAQRRPRRRGGGFSSLKSAAIVYIPANLPICLACGRDYPWLCVLQAALGFLLGRLTVNGNAPVPKSYDKAAEKRALDALVTTSPRNRTVRVAMGSCNLLAAVLYAARAAKARKDKEAGEEEGSVGVGTAAAEWTLTLLLCVAAGVWISSGYYGQ